VTIDGQLLGTTLKLLTFLGLVLLLLALPPIVCSALLGVPIVCSALLGVVFCLDFGSFFFFSSLVPLSGVSSFLL
jgi:hypothetical protein